MAYTEFYSDLEDLGSVDWNVIGARYWNDTPEDGDRKRRRQAEFLVRNRFPLALVTNVVVRTESIRESVEKALEASELGSRLVVNANWYY
jgi:hypothetical protein